MTTPVETTPVETSPVDTARVDTAAWTNAEREAFAARRRSRNQALLVVLVALVALFFGITIVRMSPEKASANGAATNAAPATNAGTAP
jgi:uncharacterized membrane protein